MEIDEAEDEKMKKRKKGGEESVVPLNEAGLTNQSFLSQ
jgi:hypothetical protein